MDRLGAVIGRFQIFHNDHLKYLLAGRSLCEHLIIGITNPDPSQSKDDSAAPHRHLSSSNPLTYFERYVMLKAVLNEFETPHHKFSIVPFPINFPELYSYYIPSEAVFYLTIYDSWGKKKLELLSTHGLRTHVIWEKSPEEKGLTGTEVRRRILFDEAWEQLVPNSVSQLILDWNIRARMLLNLRPAIDD
ncbi:MAG: adenylyltransferase/cytidyltransferase family protein [Deltaproteobacteria bacterium]|nr:adenylyltransferase/cytidyltransferase family protein [Deltaproteobacteria bacterium]